MFITNYLASGYDHHKFTFDCEENIFSSDLDAAYWQGHILFQNCCLINFDTCFLCRNFCSFLNIP